MRNDASENRAKAENAAAHARHKVDEQSFFLSTMTSSDPRIGGATKLLRQMEQSLASAELTVAVYGYDDDAFAARIEEIRSGKA